MTYKESFLRFMVDCGVLTFGEFTLKSGRKAPYFINAGNYHSGAQLMELGRYYAACIAEHNIPVETVFGPAYKGIPLAAAAAVALADKYQKDVNFCFDRKEVKDVMTSGKAMAEVYPKLKSAADVDITGMVITVDRMERALEGEKSAVQAVYEKYGVPVYSIVNMEDIIQGIRDEVIPGKEHLDAMLAYREQYGVKA